MNRVSFKIDTLKHKTSYKTVYSESLGENVIWGVVLSYEGKRLVYGRRVFTYIPVPGVFTFCLHIRAEVLQPIRRINWMV